MQCVFSLARMYEALDLAPSPSDSLTYPRPHPLMASDPTPVVSTRPTYSSIFSFISLLVSCGAGYYVFLFYRNGAGDELKYGGLVLTITAVVLCCVLVARSLTKVELTIWGLQSVKVCIGAAIFQTVVASIYLYAAFRFPALLFEKPIIYTVITCVVAIHGYMLYANIQQTRLIFLSLTIGVLEFIASIVVVILGLLYVLSKMAKVEDRNGNSPTRSGQSTIGGPGRYEATARFGQSTIGGPETYEATAYLGGFPRTVRVQANSLTDAIAIFEGQYGKDAFGGWVHPRKV